jgi:hypothetical protein
LSSNCHRFFAVKDFGQTKEDNDGQTNVISYFAHENMTCSFNTRTQTHTTKQQTVTTPPHIKVGGTVGEFLRVQSNWKTPRGFQLKGIQTIAKVTVSTGHCMNVLPLFVSG